MLRVDDLSVCYGKKPVIDHVSAGFKPGRIYGLVAPNGCGKSTLLRAMAGTGSGRAEGTVSVDTDEAARSGLEARRRVFYAPGEGTLLYPGLTAADHLKMARDLWASGADLARVAADCRVDGFGRKRVRSYSQGMKQQLTLAIAYATGARYLLLDEPMNALDPTNVAVQGELIRRAAAEGGCVVLSSHILGNVDELCDTVLFLKDGKLLRYSGKPKAAQELYRKLYGDDGERSADVA